MNIIQKISSSLKISWPILVVLLGVLALASFFVYKAITADDATDAGEAINEEIRNTLEEIAEAVDGETELNLKPLEEYLANTTCGNASCDYGEDSARCSADCVPAEIQTDAWTQVNGPYGGYITDLIKSEDALFASTAYNLGPGGNGIYKISSDGLTWEGGATKASFHLSINPNNTKTIAFISEGELHLTNDGGKHGKQSNLPMAGIKRLRSVKQNRPPFATTNNDGVSQFYASTDNGKSWMQTSSLPTTEWSVS